MWGPSFNCLSLDSAGRELSGMQIKEAIRLSHLVFNSVVLSSAVHFLWSDHQCYLAITIQSCYSCRYYFLHSLTCLMHSTRLHIPFISPNSQFIISENVTVEPTFLLQQPPVNGSSLPAEKWVIPCQNLIILPAFSDRCTFIVDWSCLGRPGKKKEEKLKWCLKCKILLFSC